ncbi:Putative membrane spanning protein [Flavobacterium psychrophilum]|nr:Putative membrane spanning protein [Flavobacterium psychrophilum]
MQTLKKQKMKNILVIYYSQSGQLESIARNIAKPLLNSDEVNVVFHEIQLEKPFPFPWNKDAFFDAFPESFLQIPTALKTRSHRNIKHKIRFNPSALSSLVFVAIYSN